MTEKLDVPRYLTALARLAGRRSKWAAFASPLSHMIASALTGRASHAIVIFDIQALEGES